MPIRQSVIAQKAAKPQLIASYGSSVSPLEIVRVDPAARQHATQIAVEEHHGITPIDT